MSVQLINEILRDFERYTGDGKPNEPVGHPLPIGDPRSGIHDPAKYRLRELLLSILQAQGDPQALQDILDQLALKADDADVTAVLRNAGLVTLANVSGTGNAIAGEFPAALSGIMGAGIPGNLIISFISPVTTTGPATLTIGTDTADLRQGHGSGLTDTINLDQGQFYGFRRNGDQWRMAFGGVSMFDLISGLSAEAAERAVAIATEAAARILNTDRIETVSSFSQLSGQVPAMLEGLPDFSFALADTESRPFWGLSRDGWLRALRGRADIFAGSSEEYSVVLLDAADNFLAGLRWDGIVDLRQQSADPHTLVQLTDTGREQVYASDGTDLVRLSYSTAGDDRIGGISDDGRAIWVHEGGGVRTPQGAWMTRESPLRAGTSRLVFFIYYGQSLTTGEAGLPIITPQPPLSDADRILSWESGVRPFQANPMGTEVAPIDYHRLRNFAAAGEEVSPFAANKGETGVVQAAMRLLGFLDPQDAVLGWSAGYGSMPIQNLDKGTVAYANLIQEVSEVVAWCGLQGIEARCAGIVWKQGENNGNTPPATYLADLSQIQLDLEADIQFQTGQNERIPFFVGQQTNNRIGNEGGNYPNPPMAPLALAISDPDRFVIITPDYLFNHPDGVHLDGPGYALLGEFAGRAMGEHVATGSATPGLHMLSATIAGATLTVTFNRTISIDTSVVTDPGSLGFTLIGDASGATISSVGSPSGATIDLTLSAPPDAGTRLGLARFITDGTGSGPTIWSRSPINDGNADASTSDPARTLARHASCQEIEITA